MGLSLGFWFLIHKSKASQPHPPAARGAATGAATGPLGKMKLGSRGDKLDAPAGEPASAFWRGPAGRGHAQGSCLTFVGVAKLAQRKEVPCYRFVSCSFWGEDLLIIFTFVVKDT